MTIEPILQPKTTQGIKRRVGFLNFSLNDIDAVIPIAVWGIKLSGEMSDLLGSIELSKESFLQRS